MGKDGLSFWVPRSRLIVLRYEVAILGPLIVKNSLSGIVRRAYMIAKSHANGGKRLPLSLSLLSRLCIRLLRIGFSTLMMWRIWTSRKYQFQTCVHSQLLSSFTHPSSHTCHVRRATLCTHLCSSASADKAMFSACIKTWSHRPPFPNIPFHLESPQDGI